MRVVAILLIELLAVATIYMSFCTGSTYVGCIKSEREALLRFKQDLIDPSNMLSSWTSTNGDCCTWSRVVCDNFTGHVLKLNFRNPPEDIPNEADEGSYLSGKINPSLLDLKHLIHLDLSSNFFIEPQIPTFLGSMMNLRYLNLSEARFKGMIPSQLGNLSNLQYFGVGDYGLYVENLSWLSGLSSLKELDLSHTNLSQASDWLLEINILPSLEVLKLSSCELHHFPPLPVANFSSLDTLDLSNNQFNSTILSWVFSLSNLAFLSLSGSDFVGPVPDGLQYLAYLSHLDLSYTTIDPAEFESLRTSLGRLCNLRSIVLSGTKLSEEISEVLNIFSGCISHGLELLELKNCQLSGHLTDQLLQFNNLYSLDLSDNSIAGPIPSSLGELSSLEYLDLSNNKFNGTLSQIHFVNLTRLWNFFVSGNSLMLNINPQWVPTPSKLEILGLRSCYLGGSEFPSWLYSLKYLSYLDVSSAGISSNIPTEFWKFASQLTYLNLSHNQFYGKIPNLSEATNLTSIDLNSNNFSGPLPLISSRVSVLDLSNNKFLGSISLFLCRGMNKSWDMQLLKLEENLLSGELPDCWMNWSFLSVLNLGNNRFIGKIPTSMGTLNYLWSLNLRKNGLFGTIPTSLKNLTELRKLDIGENELFGNVPPWIGESFSSITVLSLPKNKFHGPLPVEFCRLSSLQNLDLSHNNLSGYIPKCINNFTSMITEEGFDLILSIGFVVSAGVSGDFRYSTYQEDALVVTKGEERQYTTNLPLLRSINLSKNNFSGEIPNEVTDLGILHSLNLSHNFLTGRISERIGAMTSLESIDFSANQLTGEIPQSIANLTFLSDLNLSNNNLIGRIPSSTQMQSFSASSFTGNKLCGLPLPESCAETDFGDEPESGEEKDGEEHEVDWFYVSMALGFVVGLWGVIGPLLVNSRWRYKYCHFLDWLGDKFVSFVRKCC